MGLIDIGAMIYAIKNQISYSSSFNIFALIAGLYVYRQNLKAAKFVTAASAFFLTGFAWVILIFPMLQPLDLWAVQIRLFPVYWFGSLLFAGVVVAALAWTYLQLRKPAVLNALEAARLSSKPPKLAIGIALVLVSFLTIMMLTVIFGPDGKEAKRRAAETLGPQYRYHVNRVNWHGNSVSADVTAYSEKEIRNVPVTWDKKDSS